MARVLPGLGLTGFWGEGFDGWGDDMDANLRVLSALVQCRVLSRTTWPPAQDSNSEQDSNSQGAVDGDIYILPANDSNSLQDSNSLEVHNYIAIRDGDAWVYVAPQEGFMAYVVDEAIYVIYQNGEWTELETGGGGGGSNYLVAGFASVAPGATIDSARATAGSNILPRRNLEIAGVAALINAGGSGETFIVSIFEIASAGANLGTLIAQSGTISLSAAGEQQIMGIFASPVTLTAGQLYVMLVTRTDSTNNADNRVRRTSAAQTSEFTVDALSFNRNDSYLTTAPAPGQASGANGTTRNAIWPVIAV